MKQPEDWIERTKIVASFIEPNSYVVDFGSGEDRLQKHLPPGCLYTPFDKEHDLEQFRLDVEADDWSVVPGNYDVAVVCGLIEHIYFPVKFLSKITAPVVILTYNPMSNTDKMSDRLKTGWKNHYTFLELVDIMQSLGYHLGQWENWNNQVVCKFVRRDD